MVLSRTTSRRLERPQHKPQPALPSMDPFTAISLAGNILQFSIYLKDIYRQADEIRKSPAGFSEKHQEILSASSRFTDVVENITLDSSVIEDDASIPEKKIRDLGRRCVELAHDTQKDVESQAIKKPTSLIKTAKRVVLGTWNMTGLERRLQEVDELQKTLFKNLVAHIKYLSSPSKTPCMCCCQATNQKLRQQ